METGNIGLVNKPRNIWGWLIRFFMPYTHSFHFVVEKSQLYVYEMSAKGAIRTLFIKSKYATCKGWVMLKPIVPYTANEQLKFANMAAKIYNDMTKYDIITLLKHASMATIGRMPIEKKFDNKYICSEFTAICANAARPYTFRLEETVSPNDIAKNKLYEKVVR